MKLKNKGIDVYPEYEGNGYFVSGSNIVTHPIFNPFYLAKREGLQSRQMAE